MMKAIYGRDIRTGDTIDVGRGFRGKVLKHLYDDSAGIQFQLDIGQLSFLSVDVVGLLYRSWPEGKTEDEMLNNVIAALVRAGSTTDREELKKRLPAVREAIYTYELGKPLIP